MSDPMFFLWPPDPAHDAPRRRLQHLYAPLPYSLLFLLWRFNSARTYIKCPFAEKDDAKAVGARFDWDLKLWWFPSHVDPSPFARWNVLPAAVAYQGAAPPRQSLPRDSPPPAAPPPAAIDDVDTDLDDLETECEASDDDGGDDGKGVGAAAAVATAGAAGAGAAGEVAVGAAGTTRAVTPPLRVSDPDASGGTRGGRKRKLNEFGSDVSSEEEGEVAAGSERRAPRSSRKVRVRVRV